MQHKCVKRRTYTNHPATTYTFPPMTIIHLPTPKQNQARVMASAVEWKDTPEAQELQATLVPNLMQQNVYDVQPSFFSVRL